MAKKPTGWGSINPERAVEDVIYPGETVVLMDRSEDDAFLFWMTRACPALGIEVRQFIFDEDGWNRDLLIKTSNGPSLYYKLEWGDNQSVDFEYSDPYSEHFKLHPMFHRTMDSPLDVESDEQPFRGPANSSPAIPELCGDERTPSFFGIHHEPLSGGNIIAARNTSGQLKFIVGEVGVFATWFENFLGRTTPRLAQMLRTETIELRARKYAFTGQHYSRWKKAKARLRELLLTPESAARDGAIESDTPQKSVVFVPQWAYHIDLQMLYIGRGVILLHSFARQAQLANQFGGTMRDLLPRIRALELRHRDLNLKTKATLERHGFRVIDVVGVFPLDVSNGLPSIPAPSSSLFYCFLNGISVRDEKVLVPHNLNTQSDFVRFAYTRFKETLEGLGRVCIPIGNHLGGQHEDVQQSVLENRGGLRCRIATLPVAAWSGRRNPGVRRSSSRLPVGRGWSRR